MTRTDSFKLLITGGGTGGHLFPAIAVAEAAKSYAPKCTILFVGSSRDIDALILKRLDVPKVAIRSYALMGTTAWQKVRSLIQLPLSIFAAMSIIRQFKPDVVFGVGGFVTGPVILAARILKVPTCIHEQNSIPGLTNRILARIADRICVSLPDSASWFPPLKTILTGNPIRHELKTIADKPRAKKAQARTLLVLGGSQGAHRINTLMMETMKLLAAELPAGFKLIHQTGKDDNAEVQNVYAGLGFQAEVQAFFQDMATIYQEADLVLSRAGATTLAELTLLGKPAILIPYPFAADNHQLENARYLVSGGCALLLSQDELTGTKLKDAIQSLLENPVLLGEMAERAKRMALPDAEKMILNECFDLGGVDRIPTESNNNRSGKLTTVLMTANILKNF